MFSFVVKKLGFIKSIPLTALIFDSGIKLWQYIFEPKKLILLDSLEDIVLSWEGVDISLHKFGGTQFNFHKNEIGHVHSNGILDILFDRETKNNLILEGKAEQHHVFEKSGWISFYIKSEADIQPAAHLLRESYLRIAQKST
ncbi:luciferase domain-containing protein [Pedobacter yonginense]|nr:luciferase family protein [Pedobacter yonginense]